MRGKSQITSRTFRRRWMLIGVVSPIKYQCRRTWRSNQAIQRHYGPAERCATAPGFGILPKPKILQNSVNRADQFTQFAPKPTSLVSRSAFAGLLCLALLLGGCE